MAYNSVPKRAHKTRLGHNFRDKTPNMEEKYRDKMPPCQKQHHNAHYNKTRPSRLFTKKSETFPNNGTTLT
ncbi:MAG: hypothetical protein CL920_17440 [Deltaproteobacteria bacterium]|nr:hypothetical protein [Deltaproteobacteria bacterium]